MAQKISLIFFSFDPTQREISVDYYLNCLLQPVWFHNLHHFRAFTSVVVFLSITTCIILLYDLFQHSYLVTGKGTKCNMKCYYSVLILNLIFLNRWEPLKIWSFLCWRTIQPSSKYWNAKWRILYFKHLELEQIPHFIGSPVKSGHSFFSSLFNNLQKTQVSEQQAIWFHPTLHHPLFYPENTWRCCARTHLFQRFQSIWYSLHSLQCQYFSNILVVSLHNVGQAGQKIRLKYAWL